MKNSHYSVAKEEMEFYGNEDSSLQNLLACIIGPKAIPAVTGELASLGVHELSKMSSIQFMEFEGIGKETSSRLTAALGLSKRLKRSIPEHVIRSKEDVAHLFADMEFLEIEHFDVAFLNTKNQVIQRKNISKGCLDRCPANPREVFKEALKYNPRSIILCHNHPSGVDSMPSREDIVMTKKMIEVGKIMDIEVLDHIIIGRNGSFTSLKEKGYF